MDKPKFKVTVKLTGTDGNAFAIMGAVIRGLKKAGATPADIRQYQDEAMSGDYDHLLQTSMAWVDVK